MFLVQFQYAPYMNGNQDEWGNNEYTYPDDIQLLHAINAPLWHCNGLPPVYDPMPDMVTIVYQTVVSDVTLLKTNITTFLQSMNVPVTQVSYDYIAEVS